MHISITIHDDKFNGEFIADVIIRHTGRIYYLASDSLGHLMDDIKSRIMELDK